MKRLAWAATAAVLVAVSDVAFPLAAVEADPHAYFSSLVSNPAHWKSYSLRDNQQLVDYANCRRCPLAVTYDPANDTYAGRQDAAKVVVPAFRGGTTLALPVGPSSTQVVVTEGSNTLYIVGRQIKIDSEILTVVTKGFDTIAVSRGTLGTTAAAHAAGAKVEYSSNSLPNQVWLPMGTEDGHTYLTTWDAWYGQELLPDLSGVDTWKTFQFRNQAKVPTIWFEVRTRFDQAPTSGHIAQADVRYYGNKGPNITLGQPLQPQAGKFGLLPGTWVRYWMLLDQRQGDWDLASLWVADEHHDAVLVIDRVQVDASSVTSFQLEFNTSKDRLEIARGDLVTYVRNVVMLRDVRDPEALLSRPMVGETLGPPPPVNVRILRTP